MQWQIKREKESALQKLSITLRFPSVVSTAREGEIHSWGARSKEMLESASSEKMDWRVS